jgi:TetR/AcrR family transcriptional repressor of nem operon
MTAVMRNQSEPALPGKRAQQKNQTRLRILQTAGGLFREHGIDTVSVDAIMREAGLTHGGFYAHFPSKEALITEVCIEELSASAKKWIHIADSRTGDAALARIVTGYLRPENVTAGDGGCVLPVLGSEVARRQGSCGELTAIMKDMTATLSRCLPAHAQAHAPAIFAALIGAVVMARLSTDQAFKLGLIDSVRDSVLRILSRAA